MSGRPKYGRYSKERCIEFIRMKLRSDDEWAFKGMHRIYSFQTPDEKASSETVHHNCFGFNTSDGYLSSLCRSGRTLDQLSDDVKRTVRNKVKKYGTQLFRIIVEQLHTEELLFAHMDRYFEEERETMASVGGAR